MKILGHLPRNFIQKQMSNSRSMIDMGIWSGIDRRKFDIWCNQFETEEEKVLLSLLLSQIVYRTKGQVSSLMHQIFEKCIPQALFEISKDEKYFTEIQQLKKGSKNKNTIIIPVIRSSEPPTKSGPLIARLFKKNISISDSYMRWPWDLGDITKIENVIFIDDFVGSGDQFLEFIETLVDTEILNKNKKIIYTPITANSIGIKKINSKIPEILISPAEKMNTENSFFETIKKTYRLDQEAEKELYDIYDSFLKKVKLYRIGKEGNLKYGYEQLGLTYAYEHGTPNATLPILWASNENYTSLFSR